MINALTVVYLICFASCGWFGVYRIWRRKSSSDLSVWREVLLLVGVVAQFMVMRLTHADFRVWLSPINSFISVALLLVLLLRYR